MVIGIFVFAFVGQPDWYWLILSRILLLPVIAGIAYELIRCRQAPGEPAADDPAAPRALAQRLTMRRRRSTRSKSRSARSRRCSAARAASPPEERMVEVMAYVPRIVRQATVAWEGSLRAGAMSGPQLGPFELPIDLRPSLRGAGKTSPELGAAALAGAS